MNVSDRHTDHPITVTCTSVGVYGREREGEGGGGGGEKWYIGNYHSVLLLQNVYNTMAENQCANSHNSSSLQYTCMYMYLEYVSGHKENSANPKKLLFARGYIYTYMYSYFFEQFRIPNFGLAYNVQCTTSQPFILLCILTF